MTNHQNLTKVVTWQSDDGDVVHITPAQERQFRLAGVWPRNWRGREYCQVSHGLHYGTPTFDDIGPLIQRQRP
jgi:hypothetical protein